MAVLEDATATDAQRDKEQYADKGKDTLLACCPSSSSYGPNSTGYWQAAYHGRDSAATLGGAPLDHLEVLWQCDRGNMLLARLFSLILSTTYNLTFIILLAPLSRKFTDFRQMLKGRYRLE